MGSAAISLHEGDAVRELSMKEIVIDPARFQTRAEIDMEVVNDWVRLVKSGNLKLVAFPPVMVVQTPDGQLILVDGHHRATLHEKLRRPSIRAVIVPAPSVVDGLVKGITANLERHRHRAVTDADRRHAIELLIRNEKSRTWNDSHLARVSGTHPGTVIKIRVHLKEREGIPFPERVQTFRSDGTPMNKTTPYRLRSAGRTSVSPKSVDKGRRPAFVATIGGIRRIVGETQEEAEAAADLFEQRRRATLLRLGRPGGMASWLTSQGIAARALMPHESRAGGALFRDTVFFSILDVSAETALQKVGAALIYRKLGGPAKRIVLVGYRDGAYSAGQIFSVLPSEPVPMEFMTPDQVVTEFGPPPDDDSPPA